MTPTYKCKNCNKTIIGDIYIDYFQYGRWMACSQECADELYKKEQIIMTLPPMGTMLDESALLCLSLDDLKEVRAKFGEFAVFLENKLATIPMSVHRERSTLWH